MSVRGWATGCKLVSQGSELIEAAAVGATSLVVDWVGDFDDEGGTLRLNDADLDYTTVDEDADTVILSAPLATAADVGDRVDVVTAGQVLKDYTLFVTLGEGDDAEVDIPFAERPMWPEGEYDDPVEVVLSDDLETVEAVPGVAPDIDPGYVLTPYLTAWMPADVSILNNTMTPVSWSSNIRAARYGWGALAWSTVDTYITVPRSGIYVVTASAAFSPNANGFRYVQIVIADFDGANERVERMVIASGGGSGSGGTAVVQAVKSLPLEEGERVIIKVQQTSGAALDLLGRLDLTAVELTWIAAR